NCFFNKQSFSEQREEILVGKKGKAPIILWIALFLASLVSCSNENLGLSDDVSRIEIYVYNEVKVMDEIKDKEQIDKLVNALDIARTASIANLDFELPDYKLFFKNEAGEELFMIGYYKEVVNLGVEGR